MTEIPNGVQLPSTPSCCSSMFASCTSLVSVPYDLLPSTSLSGSCYSSMFHSCSSLKIAPRLPATTLSDYCYSAMFANCTSLQRIEMLATNISATNCLYNWVYGITSRVGTFVKNKQMSSIYTGDSGIPYGWTVVDAE